MWGKKKHIEAEFGSSNSTMLITFNTDGKNTGSKTVISGL